MRLFRLGLELDQPCFESVELRLLSMAGRGGQGADDPQSRGYARPRGHRDRRANPSMADVRPPVHAATAWIVAYGARRFGMQPRRGARSLGASSIARYGA